jgi:8-oxo-dGTP pyrophosphatase MutT (NUDIX family)
MVEKEKIIERVRSTLSKDRAVATGIGMFGGIFSEKGEILLGNRAEKRSFICAGDFSGKWELPGGGVDMEDMYSSYHGVKYQGPVFSTLDKELREEVCLTIVKMDQIIMIPAWLGKDDILDLAFVVPMSFNDLSETTGGEYFSSFEEGLREGRIRFFSEEQISNLEIVSERMKFLIMEAFRYQKTKGL